MSEKGWVVIDRKIMDHWLWQRKPFSEAHAWIDLILLANHKDAKFMYRGKLIEGKRGVVYRSFLSLSERWGWERRKTVRFLRRLEADRMVSINGTTDGTTNGTTDGTTNGTTITIVNYRDFQDLGTTNGTTNGTSKNPQMVQSMDSRWTVNGQSMDTYNHYNNDNHDNHIGYGNNFSSLREAVPSAPLPTQDDLNRIEDAWNAIPHAVKLTHIVPMTRRYDKLREALAIVGMDGVMQAIQCVKDSEWMAKKGNIAFQDWINPDRIQELIEGKYKKIFHQAVGGGYVELKRDW